MYIKSSIKSKDDITLEMIKTKKKAHFSFGFKTTGSLRSEMQPDYFINSKMWLFRYVNFLKNIHNK